MIIRIAFVPKNIECHFALLSLEIIKLDIIKYSIMYGNEMTNRTFSLIASIILKFRR